MSKYKIKHNFLKSINSKIDLFILLVLIIGLFSYVYRNIYNLDVILYHDLAPPIHSSKEALKILSSPWLYTGLGKINTVSIESILLGMFNSPAIAQKLIFMLPIPMSGIAMYFLLEKFIKSRFVKVVVPLLYTLSPFVIDQFPTGTGMLPLYFYWPLLILFLVNIFEEPTLRNTLSFTLILSLSSLHTLQTPLLFAPAIVALYLIKILDKIHLRYTIKVTVALLTSIFFLLLLTLPSFFTIAGSFILPSETQIYGLKFKYLETALLAVYSRSYVIENFYTLFTIACILFILVSFLKDPERRRTALIFTSFMAMPLTLWFLLIKKPHIFLWLGHIFPIIFGFKDYIKLVLIFVPPYMVLLALLLDETIERSFTLSRSKSKLLLRVRWRSVYSIIFIVLIGLSIINLTYILEPFKERNLKSFLDGRSGRIDINQYEVPQVYSEIRNWVKGREENEGYFRVLLLPLDPYTSIISRTYVPNALFNFPSEKVARNIYMSMYGTNMGKTLASFDVKYIIVNLLGSSTPYYSHEYKNFGPVRIEYFAATIPDYFFIGEPNNFEDILKKQDDLKLIAIKDNFLVYENKRFNSRTSVYDGIFLFSSRPFATDKPSTNLIINPDFNDGLTAWKKQGNPRTSNWLLDENKTASGDHFVMLINNQSKRGHFSEIVQTIELEENSLYEASAWTKIYNVEESQFKIEFYNDNNTRLTAILLYNPLMGSLATGERDWWFFSQVFSTPPDTVKAIVHLMGGWNQNSVNPGITWYDDIVIIKSIYNPIPESQLLLEHQTLLDEIPRFVDNRYLMVFNDLLIPSQREFYQDISDVLVFPDDINVNVNISSEFNSKTWMFVFDVSGLTFESGNIQQGDDGAGELIEEKVSKTFVSPRSGLYEMAIRLSSNVNFSATVDHKNIIIQKIGEGQNSFWYKSSNFSLKQGSHNINFIFNEESILFDQLILLSLSNNSMFTAEDLFNLNGIEDVKVDRISPAEYKLHIKSQKPFLVILSESYHPDWTAYVNGAEVESVPALHYGWANGFYINAIGEMDLIITFKQNVWNMVISTWAISWVSLLAAVIILSFMPRTEKVIITVLNGYFKKLFELFKVD